MIAPSGDVEPARTADLIVREGDRPPLQNHQSLGYMVHLCARLFAQRMTESLSEYGVTPAYLPVLLTLSSAGSLTLGELAVHASIEQPTMTRTLTRMVRDGFVVRDVDPADRRRATVRLTHRGAAIVPPIVKIATVVNREAMGAITGISEAALMEHLADVAANLRDRDGIRKAIERDAALP